MTRKWRWKFGAKGRRQGKGKGRLEERMGRKGLMEGKERVGDCWEREEKEKEEVEAVDVMLRKETKK